MNIQKMINDYADWLKSEITFQQFGEYYELTTPYLDRHNDFLQIYIKQNENNTLTLTDNGCIINDLISCGYNFSPKRKSTIEKILKNYNIDLFENDITTKATLSDFPKKKHMMIQAMLTIDDMFVTNRQNVESFFYDDVEEYFKSHDLYPTKDFFLLGKTGNFYSYDFHFQKTKQKPERFCKTIDKLRQQSRDITIFHWVDTKEKRENDSQLIVMINDENKIAAADIDAFNSYDIVPVLYSKREDPNIVNMFSAS